MNLTDLLPAPARPYGKAVWTFAGTTVGALLLVVDGGITVREWLEVAAVVLGVTGVGAYHPRNE